MKSFVRLVVIPAIAGLVIAGLVLYLFPEALNGSKLAQPVSQSDNDMVAADRKQGTQLNTDLPPGASGPVSYSYAVKKAAPAVANIYTTKLVKQRRHPLCSDPVFRKLFCGPNRNRGQRTQSSLGSGVVISSDGYVLTNNHVIANADEIMVALQDGREGFAKIVGTDPETDLAVLKVDINDLPVISIASSSNLDVGDVVLAIGNPFGVGQTVTMGIVSATGRNQLGLTTFEDFIQTDAAINPGNSGGALINAYGDLIGVNTAIFSKSGGSQGIGFAIPSELAKEIMRQIIQFGAVERGWLGVEVHAITPALAQSFGLDNTNGVVIADLAADGPAQQAGLEQGDIIVEVDGIPVLNGIQAMNQITATKPGESINIDIIRNGTPLQIEALVAKRETPTNGRNGN